MSRASDYLRARTDTPYLIGRAWEVLFALDDIAHGGTGTGPDCSDHTLSVYADMGCRPAETLRRMTREHQRLVAAARAAQPLLRNQIDMLDADYVEAMARAELTELPDQDRDGDWGGPMASGRQHQHAEYLRAGVTAARKTLEESLDAAKAAARDLVESGTPEAEAARRVGLDRMTVRKILGKR